MTARVWPATGSQSTSRGRQGNREIAANAAAGGQPGATVWQATCNCQWSHNYPHSWGPRLGAAYQINSKTVIRGGAGVFYERVSEDVRRRSLLYDGARIGEFDVDLVREFFQGFVNHALVTLHIDNLKGDNAHHQAETVFRAFGRALRQAVSLDARAAHQIPSTKGSL